MKKVLFLMITILFVQANQAQNITYGVKGGVNYSSFSTNFDSALDYKYKLGYQLGGFAKIKLMDKLYIQPELLYILQGTKYDITLVNIELPQNDIDDLLSGSIQNKNQNESTIILPILLKYFVNNNFNIEFGPQLDYLFHVENSLGDFSIRNDIIAQDTRRSVSAFNFGINLGVAYDFNQQMGLGLRYNYGFDFDKSGDLSRFTNEFKIRNSVFHLNFEYRFK